MCGVQPDVGDGLRIATERGARVWSGGVATLPRLCALLEQLSRADPQGLPGAPAQRGRASSRDEGTRTHQQRRVGTHPSGTPRRSKK